MSEDLGVKVEAVELLGLQFATQLRVFKFETLVAAPEIDGAMLRGGHKPSARVIRHARVGPLARSICERRPGRTAF